MSIVVLLFNHFFMAIGASYRAALHFLVTAHAGEMIGTFEPYTRFSFSTGIVINGYRCMAFSARGGRSFFAMVVAACTIAGHFGMRTVREFNRPISFC